jgi:hypothetical protein
VASAEQGREDAGIDQPRVTVAESEVAQEAMAVAVEKIEVPAKSGLHFRIAVDLCAISRAEQDFEVEVRLRREQAEKRRLVLDDVGRDQRDSVHESTLS